MSAGRRVRKVDRAEKQAAFEAADADARIWLERDQFDPDCWFGIPDFDVQPQAVDFVGFERPIVYPKNPRLNAPMRGLVRTARALVRREGVTSMAEIYGAALEAFDVMDGESVDPRWPEKLTAKQYAAFLYIWIVQGLERFDASQYGSQEDSIANLAFSSEWLASWALDGAEAAVKRHLAESAHRASKNPRPGRLKPLKARVESLMHRHHAAGVKFEGFMDEWVQAGALDDLTIQVTREGHLITDDQHPDREGETYRLSSLRTMYSRQK